MMRNSRIKARMERHKAPLRDCSGRVDKRPIRVIRAENKRLATGKPLFKGIGKGIKPNEPVNLDMRVGHCVQGPQRPEIWSDSDLSSKSRGVDRQFSDGAAFESHRSDEVGAVEKFVTLIRPEVNVTKWYSIRSVHSLVEETHLATVVDRWSRAGWRELEARMAEDRVLVAPRCETGGVPKPAKSIMYTQRIQVTVDGEKLPIYGDGEFDSGSFRITPLDRYSQEQFGQLNGGAGKKRKKLASSGALGRGLDWESKAQMSQSVTDFLASR